MTLRPAAAERLEPPQRLSLWEAVFSRFFPWVWGAIAVILGTGIHMMITMGMPPAHYVSLMLVLGVVMMLLFAHVFFAPFKRLRRAVAAKDWSAGGAALGQIRKLIAINLSLGLITVTVATLGVYLG
ncbi:MAG: CopD family protein [Sulfuriferula sp.]